MPLEVISTALGRSGTKSLKVALDTLGYKTYHACVAVLEPEWRVGIWIKACKGDTSALDIIYEGWTAGCGHPTCTLYKELLVKNPQLKVIHMFRDFESWYLSLCLTLYPRFKMLVDVPWYIKVLARRIILYQELSEVSIWDHIFHGKFEDKEYARLVYYRHKAEVEKHVPAKQLLMYDLKDGWGPLCSFLGKSVPSVPFPFINTTADFRRETESLRFQVRVATVLVNTGLLCLAGGAYYMLNKHSSSISDFLSKARSQL